MGFVRRLVPPSEAQVVPQEQKEGDAHHAAHDDHQSQLPLFVQEEVLQVQSGRRHYDFPRDVVPESGASLPFEMRVAQESEHPADEGVSAHEDMQKQKEQEPPVIVGPGALVDPNAMVVELLDAHVANPTMLGARRLLDLTGGADVALGVQHVIKVIPFERPLRCLLVSYDSRIVAASPVETVVASQHEGCARVSVVRGEVRARTVHREASDQVNVKAPACNDEVEYLDRRIPLICEIIHDLPARVHPSCREHDLQTIINRFEPTPNFALLLLSIYLHNIPILNLIIDH